MGHLSNPIGFRLNFQKKWNFTFFVKNIYYPEVINNLINLRDYVYYYITRKKILQSGLCLSHFILYKYLKKYDIKIYVYHIDLEKTSYDFINQLYFTYYEVYNIVNCKFIKDKTEKEQETYFNYRDLSNSDLYLFIIVFLLFYRGFNNKKKLNYLKDNKYIINKNIKIYSRYIMYSYYRQLMSYYKFIRTLNSYGFLKKKKKYNFIKFKDKIKEWDRFLNLLKTAKKKTVKQYQIYKNIKLAKIKGRVLYKAKKLIKAKNWFFTLVQKSKNLRNWTWKKKEWNIIKLAWFLTKQKLKKKVKKIKQLEFVNNLINYEKFKKNIFFNFFKNFKIFKINKYKNFKFLKKTQLLRDIWYDKKFKKNFDNIKKANKNFESWLNFNNLINENKKRTNVIPCVDVPTLFLYFCKKMNFQKVRNSYDLWYKWIIVFKYIYLFKSFNFIEKYYVFNIHNFFFYMKTCILYSLYGANGLNTLRKDPYASGFPFNFKKQIFFNIHQGIYVSYFHPALCLISEFLKINLFLINNNTNINIKENIDNIKLTYYFLSNDSVTAQFLSRYIVLKLKKGFTIIKILNPLKRELIRVSKKSRGSKLPYSDIILDKVKIQRDTVNVYKKSISYYLGSCYTLFNILFNKFYNKNNILMYYNLYLLYKKGKANKKKVTHFIKLKKFFFIIFIKLISNINKNDILKYKIPYQQFRLNKLNKQKKLRKISIICSLILYLEKKKTLYPEWCWKKNQLNFFNNNFFSISRLLKNACIALNLKKKLINNVQMSFSAFFNKNYIKFNMVKTLWEIYLKVNIRNEKDLYIPKYNASIMGFKFVFKGRFSRKQRASKTTLLIGKVPLNTLKYKIDYSFITIPLKNSAISLKLYIYKNERPFLFQKKIII